MDKEFKKIFDKLREEMDMTNKVYRVMDGYQAHLDQMVEEGMMTEHEARMDFFCKTSDLLKSVANAHVKDEDDDDDAEDEQCDCDDEPAEADAYGNMFPETAEEKAQRKALDKLAECLRASGIADVTFHYCGHAIRRDDKR